MQQQESSSRPMAISSITSPPLPAVNLVISTSSSTNSAHQHNQQSLYPSAASSPPESPTYRVNQHNYLQQRYPYHTRAPQKHRHSINGYPTQHSYASIESQPLQRTSSMSSLQQPLSLQERRQRNKAASAKYRAKKNQQHGEMRSLISSLSKENDLLQRQLDHVRRENSRLKATCDKLRGKMLAEKMLKKLLNNGKEEDDDMDEDEEEKPIESLEATNSSFNGHAAMMQRFDQDIDFDDEDDDDEENDDEDEWEYNKQ